MVKPNLTVRKKQAGADGSLAGKGLVSKLKRTGGDAFVLTIGDEGAVLMYVKRGSIERRLFAAKPDAAGTSAMTEILATAKSAPIYMLLDVIDQQYMRQSFPPVSAMSLAKIVQRRLDRDLPADDIKSAIQLGRDKEGRKEWHYLLIAISQTPELQSWLEWLLEQDNSFKGIHLVPLEAARFLQKLKAGNNANLEAPWQIVFMHTKVGGFRQVVLHDGKLVFTRISQVTEDSSSAFLAGSVEQEIQNTLDYLRRFDLENNQVVSVCVIVGADVKAQVDLKRFGFSHHELMTPFEASQMLGQDNTALFADNYSDIIFAYAFLHGAPVKRIMPQAAARVTSIEKSILAAKIIAASVGAVCFLLSIFMLVSYVGNTAEISDTNAQQKTIALQQVQLQKIVGNQHESEKIAGSVTALWNAKKIGDFIPFDFIRQLAPVLRDDVRVTAFDWHKMPALAAGAYVEGPTDVEIIVSVEFTGAYSDDVAYAIAATAQNDAMAASFPRYKIETTGLPGQGGNDKLEIDFDNGKLRNSAEKKRVMQFKFRGLLPEPPPVAPVS